MYFTRVNTPAGRIMLVGSKDTLAAIYWEVYKRTPTPAPDWIEDNAVFAQILQELDEYFAGRRQTFSVTHQATGTAFQKQVWRELSNIGFGQTRTYQQIADAIGAPTSVRAVAGAIGRNPLSIIVPCHRVIGSNGSLTGFAGGVESKRVLLQLEGVLPADQ